MALPLRSTAAATADVATTIASPSPNAFQLDTSFRTLVAAPCLKSFFPVPVVHIKADLLGRL
jgi:hypothetical protein